MQMFLFKMEYGLQTNLRIYVSIYLCSVDIFFFLYLNNVKDCVEKIMMVILSKLTLKKIW